MIFTKAGLAVVAVLALSTSAGAAETNPLAHLRSDAYVAPIPAINECEYYRVRHAVYIALRAAVRKSRSDKSPESETKTVWGAYMDSRGGFGAARGAVAGFLRRMGGDGHKVRESLNSAHEALVAAMSIIIDRSWLRDSLETLDQSEALLSEAEEQLEQRFCDEAMKENDTWGCFVYPDRNNLRDDRMVGTHKTLESCRTAAKALIHKHRDEWPNADYECGLNCRGSEKPLVCEETRM